MQEQNMKRFQVQAVLLFFDTISLSALWHTQGTSLDQYYDGQRDNLQVAVNCAANRCAVLDTQADLLRSLALPAWEY